MKSLQKAHVCKHRNHSFREQKVKQNMNFQKRKEPPNIESGNLNCCTMLLMDFTDFPAFEISVKIQNLLKSCSCSRSC